MKVLTSFAAVAALVAVVTAGCGGSGATAPSAPKNVRLALDTRSTDGKALVISAATAKKLATKKGALYALELHGIDSGDSFDHPSFVDPDRCVGGSSCEWTVAPAKAGTYEYQAVLLDLVHNKTAGESNAVKATWEAPPRPRAITLFVNGKTPPSVPLSVDHYSDFPAGPMQVEAKWTTDARYSGYYVSISDDFGVDMRCSVGTSCRVAKKVPLAVGGEDSWTVQLMTTMGDKIADGFKVCVKGKARSVNG